MNESSITILSIDDDIDTGELIKFVFANTGCEVALCSDRRCLKAIETKTFSAIILNSYFEDQSGIEICRQIRAEHPQMPIIFFSGEVRPAEIEKATDAGANAYLVKPNDFEKLIETTLALIENSRS